MISDYRSGIASPFDTGLPHEHERVRRPRPRRLLRVRSDRALTAAGGVAGGLIGKSVAEVLNPTVELAY